MCLSFGDIKTQLRINAFLRRGPHPMFRLRCNKKMRPTPWVRIFLLWRRRRDSNPCGLAPKRFSRPPRYDRFDTPPYAAIIVECLCIVNGESGQMKRKHQCAGPDKRSPMEIYGAIFLWHSTRIDEQNGDFMHIIATLNHKFCAMPDLNIGCGPRRECSRCRSLFCLPYAKSKAAGISAARSFIARNECLEEVVDDCDDEEYECHGVPSEAGVCPSSMSSYHALCPKNAPQLPGIRSDRNNTDPRPCFSALFARLILTKSYRYGIFSLCGALCAACFRCHLRGEEG